ncbi:unnamed protein product [Somion occarium]|uniref:Transmembrane protein n=1 Tax=Somion occarium TaxID=3059160 RepID=A0ABP1EB79_9APHY
MMSACAYCQGSLVTRWSDWIINCPSGQVSNGQYPHAIPDGTAIPAWAFTTISDRWDFTSARAIANSNAPDSSAAGGPTSVFASTPTNTNGSGNNNSKPDNGKVNVGAIVGGVVGGLIGLILLSVGGYLLYAHYNHRSRPTSIRPVLSPTPPPVLDEKLTYPLTHSFVSSSPPLRLYNPEDPSTYPGANLQPLLYSNQPAQSNTS